MKLTPEAEKLADSIAREYEITDAAGLHLLRTAAEAQTRMQRCQAAIAEHGEAILQDNGILKANPLLSHERDARAAMLAALKALNLDLEPLKDVGRPGHVVSLSAHN